MDRVEDLHLPNAVVARLIKEALPVGTSISKDARAAISRAASIFVIYITSSSTKLAQRQNHKTITAKDILQALTDLEFESFVEPCTHDLATYRKIMKNKKESKNRKDCTFNNGNEIGTVGCNITDQIVILNTNTSDGVVSEIDNRILNEGTLV